MTPRFSLVVATVGRSEELTRLIESLLRQTCESFEVIVVDQNVDDRVHRILSRYDHLDVIHLRSELGVSRARNVGLNAARGEIIAFPDDDCWYPPDALESRLALLDGHPEWHALLGRSVDANGEESMGRWATRAGSITKLGVWTSVIAFNMFVRRSVCQQIGGFDESLGPGAGTPWGACEENDYILRAINAGFTAWYEPGVTAFHPNTVSDYATAAQSRGGPYGRGMGRVLRKHRFPLWFAAYSIARPALGAGFELLRGRTAKSHYHWVAARGRATGWLSGR
jgi:glycosyltransferase involved in cell wall biosynthesis